MKNAVLIELDKVRNLRYGINALCTIEEFTGKPITTIDLNNLSIKDLRTILYAGLLHEDNQLTPEKVGSLIDDYSSVNEVAQKLAEALTLAFGSPKNKKSPQKVAKSVG